MRITPLEKKAIMSAVRAKDPYAQVWLFGSRTDDSKKGGDIDIAVLSRSIKQLEKMRIRRDICDAIGEQKIDIIVSDSGRDAFFQMVMEKGVVIDE